MSRLTVLLLLLVIPAIVILSGASVSAVEDVMTPAVGDKVRVYLDTSEAKDLQYYLKDQPGALLVLKGHLLAKSADSLVVEDSTAAGGLRTVPRDDIRALYVHEGHRKHVAKGALAGGLLGLTAGLALSASDKNGDEGKAIDVGYVMQTTGIGLFAGGIVGAILHSERWRRVVGYDIDPSVTMGYNIEKQQVMLSVRF